MDGLGLATFVKRGMPSHEGNMIFRRDAPRSVPSSDFDMFRGKPVTSRPLR